LVAKRVLEVEIAGKGLTDCAGRGSRILRQPSLEFVFGTRSMAPHPFLSLQVKRRMKNEDGCEKRVADFK
jgi:hypothetical protein